MIGEYDTPSGLTHDTPLGGSDTGLGMTPPLVKMNVTPPQIFARYYLIIKGDGFLFKEK